MLKTYAYAQTKIGQFKNFIDELRQDEEGAAMIEYALILGLVAVFVVGAIITMRGSLNTKFGEINTALNTK
ncbi:Flp family type IVb pilin [Phenylobacterium sp.]|jgi:pilus assembly protein Flp/PilA|uniref:Flp family type IVb pilin n=1 Tax=Phenylobacterium sp. TaxID=1871053 RepID=UPI002F940A67